MSFGAFIVIALVVLGGVIVMSILGPGAKTNPEMHRVKRLLVARTSTLRRVLSLFSSDFMVRVDAKAGYITIESRRFWFLKRERMIPTKAVKWVDFRYVGAVSLQRDLETYRAVLVLSKKERVPLFDFTGHPDQGWLIGARDYNPAAGTYTGNPAMVQDQHMDALWYVRTLCQLLDVPMAEPVDGGSADGRRAKIDGKRAM